MASIKRNNGAYRCIHARNNKGSHQAAQQEESQGPRDNYKGRAAVFVFIYALSWDLNWFVYTDPMANNQYHLNRIFYKILEKIV